MLGQPKNEHSKFRHRGYECKVCKSTAMVYGQDSAPHICDNCGQIDQFEKKWDHLVESQTKISPFVEPAV